MNMNAFTGQPMGGGGMGMSSGSNTDMFGMIKQMLMTSMIFKNVNNPNGQAGGGSQDYFSIIYVFIATQIIDVIMKYLPIVFSLIYSKCVSYLEKKVDVAALVAEQNIKGVVMPKKKTSSVIISINISDIENILGQALLEHITNHKSTQHTYYTKKHFILNQKDVLCIGDDVYSCMTQNSVAKEAESGIERIGAAGATPESAVLQVIEVFSYSKTSKELREFLNDISKNYIICHQNKLGTRRFFFNMVAIVAPVMQSYESGGASSQVKPANSTFGSPAGTNSANMAPPVMVKDLSRLPSNFLFTMKPFETNRSFINLFGEEIELIKKRVRFFTENKKWYDEKGIPYTLGLLLSGQPGTGKTSTIKCLANETNRHIININFNNDITKTQLESLFFNEDVIVNNPYTGKQEKYCIPLNQRIYVLEDVDCQGNITHDRSMTFAGSASKQSHDPLKVDLSFLLNLLDGVLETPGRMVIMTSNFPEILDKALIRPGRIDIISEFKKCSNPTIAEMLEFFYDTKLSETDRTIIMELQERMITPAELSKVMFENFYDIQQSINHLTNLSQKIELKPLEEKRALEELAAQVQGLEQEKPAEEAISTSSEDTSEDVNPFLSKTAVSKPEPEPVSVDVPVKTLEKIKHFEVSEAAKNLMAFDNLKNPRARTPEEVANILADELAKTTDPKKVDSLNMTLKGLEDSKSRFLRDEEFKQKAAELFKQFNAERTNNPFVVSQAERLLAEQRPEWMSKENAEKEKRIGGGSYMFNNFEASATSLDQAYSPTPNILPYKN